MALQDIAPWAALVLALLFLLWLDLHFFARGREPSFREAVTWSIGWLILGLSVTGVVIAVNSPEAGIEYTTVYLIERSLSLDNLFVFIMLFTYFGVPEERRARLLFWGIVAALALRGVFILVGLELIERFHIVIYILGALLLVLAYRIFRGVTENVDPEKNLFVRAIRRVYPVTEGFRKGHWFAREDGKLHVTPLFLCLVAIVFADIAFAIDSIPAAFAITDDPAIIWAGNVFALLGLRALFVLVEELIERFRYLDETIAIVLGIVGIKLLIEDLVKIGPVVSLGIIAVAFTVGILLSIRADRREGIRRRGGDVDHYSEPDADAGPYTEDRGDAADNGGETEKADDARSGQGAGKAE